jgi:hypothetical protein
MSHHSKKKIPGKRSVKKQKKSSKSGRKWSLKYKRSINCNRPRGFSQKQYCKRKSKKPIVKKSRKSVRKKPGKSVRKKPGKSVRKKPGKSVRKKPGKKSRLRTSAAVEPTAAEELNTTIDELMNMLLPPTPPRAKVLQESDLLQIQKLVIKYNRLYKDWDEAKLSDNYIVFHETKQGNHILANTSEKNILKGISYDKTQKERVKSNTEAALMAEAEALMAEAAEMEADAQVAAEMKAEAEALAKPIPPELFEKIWKSSLYEFIFRPKITPKPKNPSLFITALRTILQNASATGYNYFYSSFVNSKFVQLLKSAKASLESIGGEVGAILGEFVGFSNDLIILIVQRLPAVGNNIKLFTWVATMISIPLVAFIKLASLPKMAFRGTFALLAYNIVVECLVLMNRVLKSGVCEVRTIKKRLKELFSNLLTRARNRLNYLVNSSERLVSLPARFILRRTNRYNQQLASLVDDPEINKVIGPVLSTATKNTAKELRNIVAEYFKLIKALPPGLENIERVQSATQSPTNSSAFAQPPQNITVTQPPQNITVTQPPQNITVSQLSAQNSLSSQNSDSESDIATMGDELFKMFTELRTDRDRAQRPQGPPKPNSTEAPTPQSVALKPQRRTKLKSKEVGNSTGTAQRKPMVSKTPPNKHTRSSSRLKN